MTIFENNCFGCSSCAAACPRGAIDIKDNVAVINGEKCIECGICRAVCPDINPSEKRAPISGYAASGTNDELTARSASGGAFAAIAERFIERGGIVYGAAEVRYEGKLTVRHTSARTRDELFALQGSKYAKSETSHIWREVKDELERGGLVLFSGTPCQVDALRAFLKHKEYPELYTVDLICHGVPPAKMFEDYISLLEKSRKATVRSFRFRGKRDGWGKFAFCAEYEKKNGSVRSVELPAGRSSYYKLFLRGASYRENCYSCPYASLKRVADITLGDWWGIEQSYPELLGEGGFSAERGISCVLVNTEKGAQLLSECEGALKTAPTAPEQIARHNAQLREPQKPHACRAEYAEAYAREGYVGVERVFKKELGIKYYLYRLEELLRS